MKKVKTGIIGCGNISDIYLKNCSSVFESIEVKACADILPERAGAKAGEYHIRACSIEELLADPEIGIVVNLTVPAAHYEICMKALEAGKNVYTEKPFSLKREEGKAIVDLAAKKGLLAGGAPDTFLGGGLQTCRKLIDDGWIGRPVAATAFFTGHGPEGWHPNPEFFYKYGGGPLFDMGPYYLTALVAMLGPVRRVTASAGMSFPERTITCGERFGDRVKVEIPTHIAGVLDFECGAIASVITSFDIWSTQLPCIEIYGSEGTLRAPDPNLFEGPVYVRRYDCSEWKELPLTHGYTVNSRGVGVADMAAALQTGRRPRAGSELTYHVLDIMNGLLEASESGSHYAAQSTCRRPDPLPVGLLAGKLD